MQVIRRLTFCAGHRVYGHETKCRNLHGHNFVVYIHAASRFGLDSIGRVIDFSVLKQRIGTWIDENWDHGFILWQEDDQAIAAVKMIPDQKMFLLSSNPTSENIALELLHNVAPKVLADTDVYVTKVVLWETENCIAEALLHVR